MSGKEDLSMTKGKWEMKPVIGIFRARRVAISNCLAASRLWNGLYGQPSTAGLLKPPFLILKAVSDCRLLRYISRSTKEVEMKTALPCLRCLVPWGRQQTPELVCLTTWKQLSGLGPRKDWIPFPFSHNSSPVNTRLP